MMLNNEIVVTVKFNFELSFWQAIKLRIAGRNMQPIVEEILKELKANITLRQNCTELGRA